MRWLEIIELRGGQTRLKRAQDRLRCLVDGSDQKPCEQTIRIYSHGTMDTCISVHLLHHCGEVARDGSPLGLQLVFALQEFGMINHSIWIQTGEKPSGSEKSQG